MKKFATILAFLLLAIPASASSCPEHYVDGVLPNINNENLYHNASELCYTEFGLVHSGLTRTALWAAEVVSADRIKAARSIDREDVFFAEPSLHKDQRSELSDYSRSGYDRGHLAPSGDMGSRKAQAESFTLANIVPQDARNNRVLWRDIEAAVRDEAISRGTLYVVTGPLFVGDSLKALKGRVLVPTHLFKAVYDPSSGTAGVYITANDSSNYWDVISVNQLAELSGFDVFPTLGDDVKNSVMLLPRP